MKPHPGSRPSAAASSRIRVGLFALAYFAAQVLGFLFPDSFGLIASFWPAAGVALASLLLSPRRCCLPACLRPAWPPT